MNKHLKFEILEKSPTFAYPVEEQVAIIYTGINGFLDDVPEQDYLMIKRELGGISDYLIDEYRWAFNNVLMEARDDSIPQRKS